MDYPIIARSNAFTPPSIQQFKRNSRRKKIRNISGAAVGKFSGKFPVAGAIFRRSEGIGFEKFDLFQPRQLKTQLHQIFEVILRRHRTANQRDPQNIRRAALPVENAEIVQYLCR